MHYPVIAFIGAGNMASAIIAGLVTNGYPADKIIAIANSAYSEKLFLKNSIETAAATPNTNALKNGDIPASIPAATPASAT